MLSAPQLSVFNRQLWPTACKAQGWRSGDREFRREYIGKLLGRSLESCREIGAVEEFTLVKDHLLELAGVLAGHRGAAAQPQDNALRTRRWVALRDIQCLLVYVDEAYVREVLRQRFARAGIESAPFEGLPFEKVLAEFKDLAVLTQLNYTLAARLQTHRSDAGDSLHAMRLKAGVECDCREFCRPRARVILPRAAEPELAHAGHEEEPF